jgi:hypothetical protein
VIKVGNMNVKEKVNEMFEDFDFQRDLDRTLGGQAAEEPFALRNLNYSQYQKKIISRMGTKRTSDGTTKDICKSLVMSPSKKRKYGAESTHSEVISKRGTYSEGIRSCSPSQGGGYKNMMNCSNQYKHPHYPYCDHCHRKNNDYLKINDFFYEVKEGNRYRILSRDDLPEYLNPDYFGKELDIDIPVIEDF